MSAILAKERSASHSRSGCMRYAWFLLVPLAACGSKETPAPAPTTTPATTVASPMVTSTQASTDRGAIFHCPNGDEYQTEVYGGQRRVVLSTGGKQIQTLDIDQAKQGIQAGNTRFQLIGSALTVTTGNSVETCFAQPLPPAEAKPEEAENR